jgi:hypothetical protein
VAPQTPHRFHCDSFVWQSACEDRRFINWNRIRFRLRCRFARVLITSRFSAFVTQARGPRSSVRSSVVDIRRTVIARVAGRQRPRSADIHSVGPVRLLEESLPAVVAKLRQLQPAGMRLRENMRNRCTVVSKHVVWQLFNVCAGSLFESGHHRRRSAPMVDPRTRTLLADRALRCILLYFTTASVTASGCIRFLEIHSMVQAGVKLVTSDAGCLLVVELRKKINSQLASPTIDTACIHCSLMCCVDILLPTRRDV